MAGSKEGGTDGGWDEAVINALDGHCICEEVLIEGRLNR